MRLLKASKVYEEAKTRLDDLNSIKGRLEGELNKAPEGKIHIAKAGSRVQYYLRTNPSEKTGKYIHSSELNIITRYSQKSYNEKAYELVCKEIKRLESLLKHGDEYMHKLKELFINYPKATRQLLLPIDTTDDDYAMRWIEQKYIGKEISEDVPEYITDLGEHVRSKSEINIANALYRNGIPYKYECPLKLNNGITIYPDFTILNVKNRKVIYWEHRGKMDDCEYANNSVKRIKDYLKKDIILGENLIITEETLAHPLGTTEIQKIIDSCLK